MSTYAPVVVFAYRRPEHLRRTLQSLMQCEEFGLSPVIVFFDGPRGQHDEAAVAETRAVAKLMLGDRAEMRYRDTNWGLSKSVIAGVTEVVNRYGRVIVVEDDLLVSPYFLRYMNAGLDLYQYDERVASIHGYLYAVTGTVPETFFLRGANCWGWATWLRAWDIFQEDGTVLARELKRRGLIRAFDLDSSYPYYRMLLDQTKGKNDSWAVRWYASAFLADMLTLYPGRTLVQNIGMDGSGEHCRQGIPFLPLSQLPINIQRIPIMEDAIARQSVVAYMRYLRWHLWRGRVKRVLSWPLTKSGPAS